MCICFGFFFQFLFVYMCVRVCVCVCVCFAWLHAQRARICPSVCHRTDNVFVCVTLDYMQKYACIYRHTENVIVLCCVCVCVCVCHAEHARICGEVHHHI